MIFSSGIPSFNKSTARPTRKECPEYEMHCEPVAILHGSALVGYFVPAVAISNERHRGAASKEVAVSLVSRNAITRPVLDYLKDK